MACHITIPKSEIEQFCRKNYVQKLSLFGSVLREDFRPDSDVDVLVEFASGHTPGFIRLFQIEENLSNLLGGYKVDLVTTRALNRRIRQRVLNEAETLYAKR